MKRHCVNEFMGAKGGIEVPVLLSRALFGHPNDLIVLGIDGIGALVLSEALE